MPQFQITAVNKQGKKERKIFDVSSQDEALKQLQAEGSYLVDIKPVNYNRISSKINISTKDKIFFTQNLSVLLTSGISLGEAIGILANDTPNKVAARFYLAIRADLEEGLSLSKSLAKYPKMFDSIYLSLIEAGENSGELAQIMNNLSDGMEKDQRTIQQIRSAMMYPTLVLGSLVVLGSIIVFFVLPRITTVFEQLRVTLPLATRLLIDFSKLINGHHITVGLVILFVIVSSVILFMLPSTRRLFTHLAIHTPVIGEIIRNLDLTRLSSTLALLLEAGVPIQQALTIASGTVINPKLQRQFQSIEGKLAAGMSLGQALQETSLPRTFVALVSVGERSGNVAGIFHNLSMHYGDLFDSSIKNFTSLLEPILTLIVGLVVGIAVISIMIPIYQFIGTLQASVGPG